MIKIPITKILFMDIETVGGCPNYDVCSNLNPKVAEQFDNYFDWFLKRFPEDTEITEDQKNKVFIKRSALVPEFAKIICVSFAFVLDNGEIRKQTFTNNDEGQLLLEVQKLLIKCGKLDFWLCGHNLKNFDIPMLAKRMIINGLMPPPILPSYDTKPWEIKAIDTKEIWQYGAYTSIGSLDLLCSSMDIPTPKSGGISGENVHNEYWEKENLDGISKYCEKDVDVLVQIIKKLKELK
jgi:hypothetical protein